MRIMLGSLVVLMIVGVGGGAVAQDSSAMVTVHMADGSSLPLQGWSISYEYTIREKTAPVFQAATGSRQSKELWIDKDTHPLAGSSLRIVYKKGSPAVERLVLTQAGREKKLKPKPPHHDRLADDETKDQILVPQSLDLKAETLTGTKRSFCLVSYSALVECFSEPSQQVVRVDFE
jgi:hypothetical protein